MCLRPTDAPGQAANNLPPIKLNNCSNSGQDVIILDEQVDTVGLENIRLTRGWEEGLKQDEESWPTRFPLRKPFIKPLVEQVDDNWYQGENCVDGLMDESGL